MTVTAIRSTDPITDPQEDEDELVRRTLDRLSRWSLAAKGTAMMRRARDDRFGLMLALERMRVYDAAASILAAHHSPPGERATEVAALLMRNASPVREGGVALHDWDGQAVQYTRARAWQLCAWQLDPSLPEVQPEWK